MEKLITKELVEHLKINKLINESQHGFLKNKLCLTNLLEFTENVSKCLDEGTPVDVIYLDFKKAFDKVPQERLIVKLSEHGIGGDILVWIANWLKNRKQRVVINSEF